MSKQTIEIHFSFMYGGDFRKAAEEAMRKAGVGPETKEWACPAARWDPWDKTNPEGLYHVVLHLQRNS